MTLGPTKDSSAHGFSSPRSKSVLHDPFESPFSSTPILTGSSSYQNSSAETDEKEHIYQYIRSLDGVEDILYEVPPYNHSPPPLPTLGEHSDFYVASHSYNQDAVLHIHHASQSSHNAKQFSEYLAEKGLPVREAYYLWALLKN